MLNRELKFIYYTMYKKNEIICRVFVANTASSCWPENWSPNNIKYGMQPWRFVLFSKCRLRVFRTSDKVIYLDKFSVITSILQVRMVCRDLTNFGWRGQMIPLTRTPANSRVYKSVSKEQMPNFGWYNTLTHPVKVLTNKWQPFEREHDTAELLFFGGILFYTGCVLKP